MSILHNDEMETDFMNTSARNGSPTTFVLVIGATGTQGGAVARELLAHGHHVRILTRNPDALAARLLVKAGAEVVRGDMGDPASLDAAMRGVSGVFSVQPGDASGGMQKNAMHQLWCRRHSRLMCAISCTHRSPVSTDPHVGAPLPRL